MTNINNLPKFNFINRNTNLNIPADEVIEDALKNGKQNELQQNGKEQEQEQEDVISWMNVDYNLVMSVNNISVCNSSSTLTKNGFSNTMRNGITDIASDINVTKDKKFNKIDLNGITYVGHQLNGYTLSQLKSKLDDATIELYFEKSGSIYNIKDEYKSYFSKLQDVVNYKNTVAALQDQLILQNFIKGVNRKENNASSLLYNNVTQGLLTVNNYQDVMESTSLLSAEELENLKEKAVQKFVNDFSNGNLAYAQAELILKAIGVENLSMKLESGIYTISFTYNNQTYSVSCTQTAAEKGNDDTSLQVYPETYINTFKFQGASDELIDKYFYQTSDANGEAAYVLREGKDMLSFQVEAGLKITLTSSGVDALNIGLDSGLFNEIVNAYFEAVNINGNNLYVLKASSIEQIKNVITETYVTNKIASVPDFEPSIPDEYSGYVLIDDATLEDRKANYYYMCYMTGTLFYGTEFEDGSYDKELATACGIYPTGDIFGEYMKDNEVREYLSTNFGINVPDPGNTAAFNQFVESNRELWDKLADLAAIDSNGNYTGEYNKQNVLKYFGIALTDEKVLNYAESLTYKNSADGTQTDVATEEVKNYILSRYPNLDTENLEMITEFVSVYILASESNAYMPEAVSVAVELMQAAQAKGVDPAEYISARLVDFVDMRIENPGMPIDKMNDQLAVDNITDYMLDNINSVYSDLFGQEPDGIDALLEMQDLAMLNYDNEPSGRGAYISYKSVVYLQCAKDGNLTNQEFYDSIISDLIRIFPQQIYMTYQELDELDAKIQKLSPEQILDFIQKVIDLPARNDENYQEKYNAFIEDFNNAINSSNYTSINNPNEPISLNAVYNALTGVEFNPDSIIEANKNMDNLASAISETITYQTALNIIEEVENGEKEEGIALWQIAYLYTGSANNDDIGNFLREITGIDNLYVEYNRVIIPQTSMAPSTGHRSAQGESALDTVKNWCQAAWQSVVDMFVSDSVKEIEANADLTSVEGWCNYLGELFTSGAFYKDAALLGSLFAGGAELKAAYQSANGLISTSKYFAINHDIGITESIFGASLSSGAILNFIQNPDTSYEGITGLIGDVLSGGIGVAGGMYINAATEVPAVVKTLWNKVTNSVAASPLATKFVNAALEKSTYGSKRYFQLNRLKSDIFKRRAASGMGDCFTNNVNSSGILDYQENLPKLTRNQIRDYLDADKYGCIDGIGLEGHYPSIENLRVAPYIKEDLKLLREGKSTVRAFSGSASFSEVLAQTPVGEVAKIGDKLFINNNGTLEALSLTEEMYNKLFPPIDRFIINQGNSQSCWFLSACARNYIDPSARAGIVKLFSQVGDDVYVKLPTSKFTYKFPGGELPDLRGLGYNDWNKLSNSSPWTNMLEHAESFTVRGNFEDDLIYDQFQMFYKGKTYDLKGMGITTVDSNGNIVMDLKKFVENFYHSLNALEVNFNGGPIKAMGRGDYLLTGVQSEIQNAADVMKNLSQGRNISMGILFDKAHAATVTRTGNGGVYFVDPLGTTWENFMTIEEFLNKISHVSNPRLRSAAAAAMLGIFSVGAANAQNPTNTNGSNNNNNNNNHNNSNGIQPPSCTFNPATNSYTLSGYIPNPGGSGGNAFNGGSCGFNSGYSNDIKIDSALQQLLNSLRQQGISAAGLNWSKDSFGNIVYSVNVSSQTSNGQALQNSMPNFLEDFYKQIQEGFKQYYNHTNVMQYVECYKTGGKYSTWTFEQLVNAIKENDFYDYKKGKFDIDEFTRALEDIGMNNYNTIYDTMFGKNNIYIVYVTNDDGSVTKVTISDNLTGTDVNVMTLSSDAVNGYLTLNNPEQQNNNTPVNLADFLPPGLREALSNSIGGGISEAALNKQLENFLSTLTYRVGLENLADCLQLADYFAYESGTFSPQKFDEFLNANFTNEDGTIDYEALEKFAKAVQDYKMVQFNESFKEIDDLNAWLQDIKTRDRGPNSIMGPGTSAIYWGYVDLIGNTFASAEDVQNALYAMDMMRQEANSLNIPFANYLTMDPLKIAQMKARLTTPMSEDSFAPAVYTNNDEDSENQTTLSSDNQSHVLTAPNWFKYLYKANGSSLDNFELEDCMSPEEAARLEEEIEHFQIWRNVNSSLTNDISPVMLYNLYQYDMAMFLMWSMFELPMADVSDNLSWEELYNMYHENHPIF